MGIEWSIFCQWVYNLDFAKWLSNKVVGIENKSVTINNIDNPAGGIALYYWYLWKCGENGLSDPAALNDAVKIFGKSRKNLQNHWNAISEREITIVPKNTNERNGKLKSLRFAYATLREKSKNQKAIDLAFKHLTEVETKINGNL